MTGRQWAGECLATTFAKAGVVADFILPRRIAATRETLLPQKEEEREETISSRPQLTI
jgi:hypothetical protein